MGTLGVFVCGFMSVEPLPPHRPREPPSAADTEHKPASPIPAGDARRPGRHAPTHRRHLEGQSKAIHRRTSTSTASTPHPQPPRAQNHSPDQPRPIPGRRQPSPERPGITPPTDGPGPAGPRSPWVTTDQPSQPHRQQRDPRPSKARPPPARHQPRPVRGAAPVPRQPRAQNANRARTRASAGRSTPTPRRHPADGNTTARPPRTTNRKRAHKPEIDPNGAEQPPRTARLEQLAKHMFLFLECWISCCVVRVLMLHVCGCCGVCFL